MGLGVFFNFVFFDFGRAVVHELVELGFVFGFAQTLEEGLKVLLLFFKAAQRVGLVASKAVLPEDVRTLR